MDGNGRWGLKNKNSRNAGHKAGLKQLKKSLKKQLKIKLSILLYTHFQQKIGRPRKEINFLFDLLENFLLNRVEELLNKISNLKL